MPMTELQPNPHRSGTIKSQVRAPHPTLAFTAFTLKTLHLLTSAEVTLPLILCYCIVCSLTKSILIVPVGSELGNNQFMNSNAFYSIFRN